MKLAQLCIIGLCLLLLTTACTSRRLEYQQLSQEKPEPLSNIPQDASLGNALKLSDANESSYSYTPFDVAIIVPRPTAIFIQTETENYGSVLLKKHLESESNLVTIANDSRFRPAIRTALPIEHVDRKLNLFLKNRVNNYQSIDPNTMEMAECVTMYRLDHLKEPMFICVQMTLESVYVATQAEDSDDKSFDEEGAKLLQEFAALLS